MLKYEFEIVVVYNYLGDYYIVDYYVDDYNDYYVNDY
jgi:hypothetical protein